MRSARVTTWTALIMVVLGTPAVCGVEKPLKDLPKDVTDVALLWTQPIKSVAEQSRRFDPVSGLWFGLLDGTVKSVERAVRIFVPREEPAPARPGSKPDKLLEYTF